MSEPLLTVLDRHNPACGDPPIINEENRDMYTGNFENQYGEQWVFTCNRITGEAVLRGNDIGWNTQWTVVNGTVSLNLSCDEKPSWQRAMSPQCRTELAAPCDDEN